MESKLLTMFENEAGFVSGEQISRDLRCSRTAVWKHIERLRHEGYAFEATPRRGYRLTGRPDRFDPVRIARQLQTNRFGRALKLLGETDSTQNVAHAWVAQGAPEGAVVLAERQTAGRGRMGRAWHSPKGKGIWMSLVLKPPIPLPLTPQLTLLVAVALCRTIRQLTKVNAGIKWPNDLLVGGRKISGILLESSAEDERLQYVIAGIGISVNLEENDYPEELRPVATSLYIENASPVDRTELFTSFLSQLEEMYELYLAQGFAPIRALWEALSVSLGKPIRVQTGQGALEGTAESIDENGALLVRTASGETVRVYSGDVQLRE